MKTFDRRLSGPAGAPFTLPIPVWCGGVGPLVVQVLSVEGAVLQLSYALDATIGS